MDIFQYLDPYLVLQSYYQLRKEQLAGFSYATWAQELKMQSASTLRMMVNRRKKISPRLAEIFSETALTSSDEKEYFRLLVVYAHAATTIEKNAVWLQLSRILSERIETQEVRDHVVFLSDPLLPTLQTLLSFDDQEWNPQNLAAALKVDVDMLEKSLKSLEDIGLAESHPSAAGLPIWKSKAPLLKVSTKLGDLALRAYHNACLEEAKEAQNLPVAVRRHRTLLIPLNSEELAKLHEETENFLRQTLGKYHSDKYEGRDLFKLNLNFYALTKSYHM